MNRKMCLIFAVYLLEIENGRDLDVVMEILRQERALKVDRQ
jgi:hypothetical protein